MKKWMHELGNIKFLCAIYFMTFTMLSTIASYVFRGVREFAIVTIWQLFGAAAVFTALHCVQTSRLKMAVRLPLHCVLSYITMILLSLVFGWGFAESFSVFWQFTVSFAVVYALIFAAFAVYYKNEEQYLNRRLKDYKNGNGEMKH